MRVTDKTGVDINKSEVDDDCRGIKDAGKV
jgi:hypothetical protein